MLKKLENSNSYFACFQVVALDPPKDFASYLQLKVKTKSQKSALLIILSDEESTRGCQKR